MKSIKICHFDYYYIVSPNIDLLMRWLDEFYFHYPKFLFVIFLFTIFLGLFDKNEWLFCYFLYNSVLGFS